MKSVESKFKNVFSGQYEVLNAPEDEVEAGEIVLGEISNENTKIVFSLREEVRKMGMKFAEDIGSRDPKDLTPSEKENLFQRKQKIESQLDIFNSLFWEMVKEEFPDARKKGIMVGVRKGWKVVIFKSGNSMIDEMLSNLFSW